MTLEEIMGKAINIVDQANEVVNKGIGIFDIGKQPPLVTTTVPQTATPTLIPPGTQFEGPPEYHEFFADRYKWPILIGLGLLLLSKAR